MAVPLDPTVTDIVTEGLKRGGRVTPTATQIQSAIDHALREVKADIMLVAPTHPSLRTTATTVTTRGLQRYAVPDDHNEQESITLLDAPDDFRGTAQTGSASGITFASTFNATEDQVVGKYLIITAGPGIEEYRQILSYNPSTKVAGVDGNWLTVPTASSTYIIITTHLQLYPNDTETEFDILRYPTSLGSPTVAAMNGLEFLLYPVPDKAYGLVNRYWTDLDKLDESGALFTQLLREWRSLWIQGIAVKTDQRYDEDRYQLELGIYNAMLAALGTQTCRITRVRYRD